MILLLALLQFPISAHALDLTHSVIQGCEGEGHSSALYKGKLVSFGDEEIKIKVIEEAKYESWTKLSVGKLTGFSPTYPFEGCLE